jgi:hypothetical protein
MTWRDWLVIVAGLGVIIACGILWWLQPPSVFGPPP